MIPEITLRLLGFRGESDSSNFIQYDAILGWSFIPNTNVTVMGFEWKILYSINEDGLRQSSNIKNKEKGLYRILILGDSNTEGYGIRQNRRFSNLVEVMFNKENKRVEVINAGVRGYNLTQYYLSFQRLYKKYKPELVMIAASMGDLDVAGNNIFTESDKLYYRPYYNLENGGLVLKGVPVPHPDSVFKYDKLETFKRYLRRNSALYGFLRMFTDKNTFLRKLGILLRIKKDVSWKQKITKSLDSPLYDRMLLNKQMNERVASAIINEIYNILRQNGGRLLIFLLGDDSLNTNELYYKKMSKDLGIFYTGLSEVSKEYKDNKKKYHFRFDGHFNEKGNLLIAKLLYDFLNTSVLRE